MLVGMDGLAVGAVAVDDRRRRFAREGPLVADIDPEAATSSMASSSWSTWRDSFSEDWPNCIRRSLASCIFSFSTSSDFTFKAS